jgi:arylsulfatase A-like enzyme
MFPIDAIQLPEMIENDTADLGNRARELITRGGNYHRHVIEADQWKQAVQGYLASIAFADAMVGQLLDNLAASKYADNTIVVIWSDHGWQLGEKMHWRKFSLWENVIRTVLMIRVPEGTPGLPEGSATGNTENLTSLLDIYPTLIELCKLPGRSDLDGKNLIPMLQDPDQQVPRDIITTYDFGDYSLRSGKSHYIQYVDDTEELYDLESDPNEWYNLSSDVDFEPIINSLRARLPKERIALPEESLIPLSEHHVPPVKSKEFYFSEERKEWMKRFELE